MMKELNEIVKKHETFKKDSSKIYEKSCRLNMSILS